MSRYLQDVKQALESPETTATVINAIILSKYGEEAYEWDPLTVYLEVKDDFKAEMHPAVLDRWSAMQVIMTTGSFFNRLDAFLTICNTLSDGVPFFQIFDPVTVEEAAWGIVEVALNRELLPLSYSIKNYINIILNNDGYTPDVYPEIFKIILKPEINTKQILEESFEIYRDFNNLDNVEAFIDEQLKKVVSQFYKIPDLKSINPVILQKSLSESFDNI